MSQANKPTPDAELEALVQRALSLRCTMREISEAAGVHEAVLWRWRQGTKPNWERRDAAFNGIQALIEARKDEYQQA